MIDPTLPKIEIDSFWLPKSASTIAPQIDSAWALVYWISIVFFFIVMIPMAYFIYKYKRKSEKDVTSEIDHNLKMEIFWTAIPLALCVGLFFVGLSGFVSASVAPADAYEIQVTGYKWAWQFQYPNGTISYGKIVVPKGRPVKLVMSSKDVLHSFFVPEFRVKQDVVPSSYTTLWFEATEVRETAVLCTEYCGQSHSNMLASMVVMEDAAFREWVESGGEEKGVPPAEAGAKLFASAGCSACHSTDGAKGTGPTMLGVFGRKEEFTDGSSLVVDEAYIKESILNPAAKIVKGYQPQMPVFQGVLKDRQIDNLTAYLKTLK